MASIQDAINQAQNAAADMAASQAAAHDNSGTGTDIIEGHVNPAGQVQTFSKPSMKTVQATTGLLGRNTVFLKPTEFGLQVGKEKKNLVESFEAYLDLTEETGFRLKHTIRFGNPAQYLSSYDGVTCNKGGSWHDALMKAKMAAPDAEPYFAAEIKLELAEELALNKETFPAGTTIGYDTSAPSRFSDWSDFWEAAVAAGVVDQRVKVKVIGKEISHNGNNWGTVAFELAD